MGHDPCELLRAVGVCAALGGSSAYTWLKIQATADIATVAAMTTQPLLLLGGAPGPDPEATFALWEARLHQPTVRGLVVGRSLLYPATATSPRRWRVLPTWCSRRQRTGNEPPHFITRPARWPTATSRFR